MARELALVLALRGELSVKRCYQAGLADWVRWRLGPGWRVGSLGWGSEDWGSEGRGLASA